MDERVCTPSQHLYELHFCLVRRANEKDVLEGGSWLRETQPTSADAPAASWEELNRVVTERCREDLQQQLRGHTVSKAELLEQERPSFRPLLPQRFEATHIVMAQANSMALVRFDTNDYSVPTA